MHEDSEAFVYAATALEAQTVTAIMESAKESGNRQEQIITTEFFFNNPLG